MASQTKISNKVVETICELVPGVHPRRPLGGGLSSASVYFVDYTDPDSGQVRLGVAKLASAESAGVEETAYSVARESWMGEFLPEQVRTFQDPAKSADVALLISLAKDREENCVMLRDVLASAFTYGKDKILHFLMSHYALHARHHWSSAPTEKTFRDCFLEILQTGLEAEDWYEQWVAAGFPTKDEHGLVFEDRAQRWPNPVAYYLSEDPPWPPEDHSVIRIPWVFSHGDLNPQNILCPSFDRAEALGLLQGGYAPKKTLKHVSLIDPPHSRVAPFTFDPAFLVAWLSEVLLPRPVRHTDFDLHIDAFRSMLDEIQSENASPGTASKAQQFLACARTIWRAMFGANTRMVEDTRKGFLASLAAASLWQAIKASGKSSARPFALSRLCLSAMALQRLLGTAAQRVVPPDFSLRIEPEPRVTGTWSRSASEIAAHLAPLGEARFANRRLVLVLGSQWQTELGLPDQQRAATIAASPPTQQISEIAQFESLGSDPRFSAMGSLPLLAVLDWSVFAHPRKAIFAGTPSPLVGRTVSPTHDTPDWSSRTTWYHFHVRGAIGEDELALTRPEQVRRRRSLRRWLQSLRSSHAAKPLFLCVGTTPFETSDSVELLQEVWECDLTGAVIAENADDYQEQVEMWGLQCLSGTIGDFLHACSDLARPTLDSDASQTEVRRTLTAAGLRYEGEELIRVIHDPADSTTEAPSTVEIPIDAENAQAFDRVGTLLSDDLRARLGAPERDPAEFFLGHRVLLSEVHQRVPFERSLQNQFVEHVLKSLDRAPRLLQAPSWPGAGASTLLRAVAYDLAYQHQVPTIVLSRGGNDAFEAFERLHRMVPRSFVAIADPADVPRDELKGLLTRCYPNLPAVLISSVRVYHAPEGVGGLPPLEISISESERIELLQRLSRYCPTVNLAELRQSPTDSLFLLTLEAFRGERVDLDGFVARVLGDLGDDARDLAATIAILGRFSHRSVTPEMLALVSNHSAEEIESLTAPMLNLLILREQGALVCRHEELSERILKFVLGAGSFDNRYRYKLAGFICDKLLANLDEEHYGADVLAEHVWALLNPQLGYRTGLQPASRLLESEDGLPSNEDRRRVLDYASACFPNHVLIRSHYGKWLAEVGRYTEADHHLNAARALEPTSESVLHMLGTRYFSEIRETRRHLSEPEVQRLADEAHRWFDESRALAIDSEYNYATAIYLDLEIIRDALERRAMAGRRTGSSALTDPVIARWVAHAEDLAAEGLRYINPREEHRKHFAVARTKLMEVRGDIGRAIDALRSHVKSGGPSPLPHASVQLARYLQQRGERSWRQGHLDKATKDFTEAEQHMSMVIEDPAQSRRIRLWFDCARYLKEWSRGDLLRQLHRLRDQVPESLDAKFLLMCLYFAEASETGNPVARREYEKYKAESAGMANALSVRSTIREWLVSLPAATASEYRVLSDHLFRQSEGENGETDVSGKRVRLTGTIKRVRSATGGEISVESTPIDGLFFKPRVRGKEFFRSDEGRTRVSFLVAFTYEQPLAFDVTRLPS